MKNAWLHRCSVALATLSFLSVATGTAVTSSEERPYYSVGQTHVWLGAAVAVLTIALIIQLRGSSDVWMRRCGWLAGAAIAIQAVLGLQPLPQPPVIRIAHALVGQLFFPLVLTMAVGTSNLWARLPTETARSQWLWSLTKIAPFVVFGQVVLGTLFRHGALGVGPHILGAFVAVICITGMGLPVVSRPELVVLHTPTRIFLAIAAVQVLLGFALFMMEIVDADPGFTILITMIHSAIATLTLAGTASMAVLIRRACLFPRPEAVLAGV